MITAENTIVATPAAPAYIVTQCFNGRAVREYGHRTAKAAERRIRSLKGAGEGWGITVATTAPDAPAEIAGFYVGR